MWGASGVLLGFSFNRLVREASVSVAFLVVRVVIMRSRVEVEGLVNRNSSISRQHVAKPSPLVDL